jgi:FeS assembly SUF system protein
MTAYDKLRAYLAEINKVSPELAAAMIPSITDFDDDPRVFEMIEHIRHVYDPEIPANIFELGLIYEITQEDTANDHFYIKMTLTAPNCPVAGELPVWVADAAKKTEGVSDVTVDLVWDPPWNPTCMAETAKLQLNMF